ncbi:MAG: peptidoglycan-associated lipoprotein [Candidatus Eisenbacteria bacterium]|nr:peptidoglycan-associated lipoprotein [Candidatus Eisenbacteria bacterium]
MRPTREAPSAGAEQPETRQPVTAPERVEAVSFEEVYFDFDTYVLRPDALATLSRHARTLSERTDLTLLVEGHCDERGSVEYNLALGEKRARAVVEYLTGYGVAAGRLAVVNYEEERPVDRGHSESAWARNRRAAFAITGQR